MKSFTLITGSEQKGMRKTLEPHQILVIGFLTIIIVGTLLLSLPAATADGKGIGLLDAFFTSTSAVCVTGLIVVDTGTFFTFFGQTVILLMIQIGGLGFMTFATLFAIILGRRITLKERMLLQEALNQLNIEGIVRLVRYVISFTLLIELVGAILLALHWSGALGWKKAIYAGIFHAVSAFNNAGFDIQGGFQSFTAYVGDPLVNLVLLVLIVLGGLGFAVLSELYVNHGKKVSLHTFLVLSTSAVLIVLGTIVIYLLEVNNPQTLGSLEPFPRFMAALFQAITPRTAGFNTVDISALRDPTLLFIIIYMIIGASPGSTGGGIKTTTFVSVLLAVVGTIKGKKSVIIRKRTLPETTIYKAMTISFVAVFLVITITSILSLTENKPFLSLFFEAASAFGTVGLSTGITPSLTAAGKLAIIFTMFVGRVGPLTLAFALAKRGKTDSGQIKYPEERIIIG